MSAAVAFDSISRSFDTRFGRVEALRDVSLELAENTFTAIVGPSGCGKSTLLNIAAGLDTEYGGGFEMRPAKAPCAYLFQQPRLLPWLSARRNVAFVLEARGTSRRVANERADRVLALVGLAGFESQFPGHLSGGMQQRVALARALVVDPSLMLMDEPFAALDELTARRMRRELLSLYESSPRTVLFVTHNIFEACFLADRVIVMGPNPGRIVAEVAIELDHPRDIDDPHLSRYTKQITGLIADHGGTEP